MKRKSLLTVGISLGIVLTLSIQVFAAPAIEKIQAYVNNQFTFEFDGVEKKLSEDYEIIVYKDRSYVPVRFVAENLGAKVDWNDETKKISITSQKNDSNKPADDDSIEYNYRVLPQTKDLLGYRVSLLTYSKEGQNLGDRLYLSIANDSDAAIRIDQMATKVIAGGKTYTMKGSDAVDFDTRLYNDINKDQYVEGYLRLPKELKDEKNLHVEITISSTSNQESKSQILEYNIAL